MDVAQRERGREPAPDTHLLIAAYVAGMSVLLALEGLMRLIRAVPRQLKADGRGPRQR